MDNAAVTEPRPAPPSRIAWCWFAAWVLVGALYCLALLAAMTIGVFIAPFALVLTVVLANRRGSRVGLGGLVSGAALPFAYVAFLNREGPGTICRTFATAAGSGESCTQEWSPWPFVAAALFLAGAGVYLFTSSAARTTAGSARRKGGQLAGYEITDVGPIEAWGEHYGGFSPATSLHGRRLVERELPLEFFGVTVNSRLPGDGADYRHAHSVLEELYLFFEGEGVMLLGDRVYPVGPGTAIRVGQGVMRSWYCLPESPKPLTWLCVRAGGASLTAIPSDAQRLRDVPLPWSLGQSPLAVESPDARLPEGCQRFEAGPRPAWGDTFGGHSERTMAPGRRVLDKEMPLEFIGVTVNSREPGEGAHYWHSHAIIEELYLFLEGEGVMALDAEIVPVRAGTAVRVAQGVRRSWHANADSPGALRWVCIRAGGAPLSELHDATLYSEIPLPWT